MPTPTADGPDISRYQPKVTGLPVGQYVCGIAIT